MANYTLNVWIYKEKLHQQNHPIPIYKYWDIKPYNNRLIYHHLLYKCGQFLSFYKLQKIVTTKGKKSIHKNNSNNHHSIPKLLKISQQE